MQAGGHGARITRWNRGGWQRSVARWLYPPPPFVNCIRQPTRRLIRETVFKAGNQVLDVGSGLSKGPGQWLWQGLASQSVQITRLDVVSGPNVDIVADATCLPPDLGPFDVVILQAVPEHVRDVARLFAEALRVLKPGGWIYVEMPFLQGIHADPDDFWRATPNGLSQWLIPAQPVVSGVSGGPMGALIWIIGDLLSHITPSARLNLLIRWSVRWILAPFRYVDIPLANTLAAHRLASEFFVLAQKPLVDSTLEPSNDENEY